MKVDLPTPGTPVIPILIELFFPERLAKSFSAKIWSFFKDDSIKVIACAKCLLEPLRILDKKFFKYFWSWSFIEKSDFWGKQKSFAVTKPSVILWIFKSIFFSGNLSPLIYLDKEIGEIPIIFENWILDILLNFK